jgi:hypothetical protein
MLPVLRSSFLKKDKETLLPKPEHKVDVLSITPKLWVKSSYAVKCNSAD